jgi:hypothetical protein
MSRRIINIGGSFLDSLFAKLTAYWTADDIATDVHVNNLGGSMVSATYIAGKNGNSWDMLSSTQTRYIDVPDNVLLSMTESNVDLKFTFRVWAYFYNYTSSNRNSLISKRQSNGNVEYIFSTDNTNSNRLVFRKTSENNDDYIECNTTYTPPLNTWVHIVYTDDGTKLGGKIYVNGVDVTSGYTEVGTYVRMRRYPSADVRFGWLAGSTSVATKHRGRIDELAIFRGYQMTEAQIINDYNAGVGRFYPNI